MLSFKLNLTILAYPSTSLIQWHHLLVVYTKYMWNNLSLSPSLSSCFLCSFFLILLPLGIAISITTAVITSVSVSGNPTGSLLNLLRYRGDHTQHKCTTIQCQPLSYGISCILYLVVSYTLLLCPELSQEHLYTSTWGLFCCDRPQPLWICAQSLFLCCLSATSSVCRWYIACRVLSFHHCSSPRSSSFLGFCSVRYSLSVRCGSRLLMYSWMFVSSWVKMILFFSALVLSAPSVVVGAWYLILGFCPVAASSMATP